MSKKKWWLSIIILILCFSMTGCKKQAKLGDKKAEEFNFAGKNIVEVTLNEESLEKGYSTKNIEKMNLSLTVKYTYLTDDPASTAEAPLPQITQEAVASNVKVTKEMLINGEIKTGWQDIVINVLGEEGSEATSVTIPLKITINKPVYKFKSFWDIFVWPMAGLMWCLSQIISNYGIVIIIATLLIRTAAWPIYAKSNDMSLKMQLMAPEQAKLEKKYENKNDAESRQRKSMELMQLYKKYGVGIGGCLMPILQFPIFLGFYQVLQRIPETLSSKYPYLKGRFNFDKLDGNDSFLGIHLFETNAYSSKQAIGIYILAALVGITQIISQILMTHRQKKQREQQQDSVPMYRRTAQSDQQKQTEKTMKIIMYGMTVVMILFVIRNPAGLGLYWLIGNVYSTLQSYIGSKRSQNRLEKLRERY